MRPEPQIKRDRAFDDPLSEYLAWLMDSSIQIGPVSIGLDGLIGLIPGLGDVVTNIASGLIVVRAIEHGVHRAAILRMLVNLGIDTLLGSIPVAGDVFDFAFKANMKNLKIYRESMTGSRKPIKDWAFIAAVIAFLVAMTILPILGLIYTIHLLGSSLR